MNQPALFDAGRLMGATVLCLVLGIWITLVHKNMTGASALSERERTPATPSATAPYLALLRHGPP